YQIQCTSFECFFQPHPNHKKSHQNHGLKFLTIILSIAVFHLNLLSISAMDCCAVEAPSIECAHHEDSGHDKESSDSDNKTHHKTEQCGCAVCHIAFFSQL